ncbi:ATP-binding protein [Dactylosporangium sp. CS-033363]|uniref:ATP-binding protein n=1 Tax=Dactylosporangium sp. CS-033363 TaxID=3239935 RepID=UPI003D918192
MAARGPGQTGHHRSTRRAATGLGERTASPGCGPLPGHRPVAVIGHAALLYDDPLDLADRLAAAGASGGRLVLACDPAHAAVVGARLGDPPLRRLARPDVHTRPAAALAACHRLTRPEARADRPDAETGGPVVAVLEPDAGAEEEDWARAARFEAALDLTVPGSDLTAVCAYPAATPEPLLGFLLATHPFLLTRSGRALNPGHTDPAGVLGELGPHRPTAAPPGEPRLHLRGSATIRDLDPIRRRVVAALDDVATLVRTDFAAAVNEILTNAYLHGRPPVDLTLWAGDGVVECRVSDRGDGQPDPTAGYRPRPSPTRAGAGLWLARQACDDLDIWRTADGLTVRAATATDRHRQHAGAIARAETARSRVALFTRRASVH